MLLQEQGECGSRWISSAKTIPVPYLRDESKLMKVVQVKNCFIWILLVAFSLSILYINIFYLFACMLTVRAVRTSPVFSMSGSWGVPGLLAFN